MTKEEIFDTVMQVSWWIVKYTCIAAAVAVGLVLLPLCSLAKTASKHGGGLSGRSDS